MNKGNKNRYSRARRSTGCKINEQTEKNGKVSLSD